MKNSKQKLWTYFIIIGVAILLGVASYPFHKTGKFKLFSSLIKKEEYRIPLTIPALKPALKEECPEVDKFVSFDDLKILHDSGCAFIIDARPGWEIDDEKDGNRRMILDAISLPVEDIDLVDDEGYFDDMDLLEDLELLHENEMRTVNFIQDELPKDRAYIVYCGSKECDKSERLADYMRNNFEFSNVAVYKGGWEEWKERGND